MYIEGNGVRYKYLRRTEARGPAEVYEARRIYDNWFRVFCECYCFDKQIRQSDDGSPRLTEFLRTNITGYSELLTYICSHMLEMSVGDISLVTRQKGREVHLTFSARTRREGILNPVSTFDEYINATGDEDRYIGNAFLSAYRAYAVLTFSRNVYGEEYFDIAFNCADIGRYGFKANDVSIFFRHGIAFARMNLDIDQFPSEQTYRENE